MLHTVVQRFKPVLEPHPIAKPCINDRCCQDGEKQNGKVSTGDPVQHTVERRSCVQLCSKGHSDAML